MHERWLILAVFTFAASPGFQSVSAVSHLLIEKFHLDHTAPGSLIGLYVLPSLAPAKIAARPSMEKAADTEASASAGELAADPKIDSISSGY